MTVTGGSWWLYRGGYKWMSLKEVGIGVLGVRRCSPFVPERGGKEGPSAEGTVTQTGNWVGPQGLSGDP